jgi:ATP adenylyltransferase
MALAQRSVRALRKTFSPQGFNLGINLGQAAGAGVTDHIHLHVVPRWHGDTNFMPVLADTKVMPDHLRNTYRKLRANF